MRTPKVLLLLVLAGCGGGNECTLIGCTSQLTVTLPAGVTAARGCVAEVCTDRVSDGALRVPLSRKAEGTTAGLTVTIQSTTYEGTIPLTRTTPNGRNCAPVCVNGSARVDPVSQTIVSG